MKAFQEALAMHQLQMALLVQQMAGATQSNTQPQSTQTQPIQQPIQQPVQQQQQPATNTSSPSSTTADAEVKKSKSLEEQQELYEIKLSLIYFLFSHFLPILNAVFRSSIA
jgi:hypothetical protein